MNNDKLMYIEEFGLLFDQMGVTRMAGRVFGYLIVSDEEAVSFNQIKDALQASKGSISGTLKQLRQMGMIEALSLPGDRKTYFRISNIQIGDILKSRIKQFTQFAEILERGIELKAKEDKTHHWLSEASTFYNWAGDQIEEIIDQWDNDKEKIMSRYHEKREPTSKEL
jgi:DNA-binding transcriptional regulator GbsR (MarR family)